jgi:hypothetical protein
MALPGRTENQEDRLPPERALRALQDGRTPLKAFAKKTSVSSNPELQQSVKDVRYRLKKVIKRSTMIGEVWEGRVKSTHEAQRLVNRTR